MNTDLIPGSVLELSEAANLIPAGCYRFEGISDQFLLFSVGSRILFGLCKHSYTQLLKPVTKTNQRKTSIDHFVKEYARLTQQLGTQPLSTKGLTFCMMEPSVHRNFVKVTGKSLTSLLEPLSIPEAIH